jgi:hypothetical protein
MDLENTFACQPTLEIQHLHPESGVAVEDEATARDGVDPRAGADQPNGDIYSYERDKESIATPQAVVDNKDDNLRDQDP